MRALKEIILISLVLAVWGCQTAEVDYSKRSLNAFNENLGKNKAEALDKAVNSFEEFLMTNYPNKQSQEERIRAFLKMLLSNPTLDSNWVFNTGKNKQIIQRFESSGLRQEIEIYGYEEEFPNPYDSTLRFNIRGRFLNGLAQFGQNDTIIKNYVWDRKMAGDINMRIIINSYLNPRIDYDNPLIIRMLVVDVYRKVMKWDIERKH